MIDKDTLRTARRTVERNGYTVLPPRDRDERDLDRFRTRREVSREDREDRESRPTPRPRYRDVVRDEEPVRRFKPLRGREDDVDYEDRPVRRPARPVYREDDYEEVPRTPVRREMNDDEKLGAAIRTAEENGFTIRKMSKLDQAKQVARDNGFDVRKIERPARPATGVKPQRTLVKPTTQPNVEDGIRTRTAPDTEIAAQSKAPTGADGGNDAPPTNEPKKNTYADDFMNRAAKFFGEDN